MAADAWNAIAITWLVFLVVWFLAALRVKPAEKKEGRGSRAFVLVMIVVGSFGFWGNDVGVRPLGSRFVPKVPIVLVAGALLTIAGVLLAFWARYHLGQNWSTTVTVKVGHSLVRSGPYAYLRHPIYVGLGVALAGTALAKGTWGALAGMLLIDLAFWRKAYVENAFLESRFGEAAQRR